MTATLLSLSLPVPRWASANADLPPNSNISKMVRVNIVFTRTIFKEYLISFLMICRLTLHLWSLESQKSKFSIFPALKGLQKCDKSLLENASGFLLQNATVLLQNVTGITKCDN